MNEGQASPVFEAPKPKYISMSFPDAMREVINGHKVTRVDWNDPNEYALLKNGYLTIHTKGKDHTWLVSESDMTPEDWIVIPEKN